MKNTILKTGVLALFAVGLAVTACKKKALEVVSGFTYAVSATDFTQVTFTSTSTNATSLAWDFGDGSNSTEASPVHRYAAAGEYTVKLTATGDDGTDQSSQTIKIVDPNAELTKLAGTTSKTWKLLRSVKNGRWPLEVGPLLKNGTGIWWAQGKDNDEIANRPCIMNDEWIFTRDGKMQYKTNGDFWAEGGVFDPSGTCKPATAANMTGPGGIDNSAFGDGTHSFAMAAGTKPTLTVTGLGAFIGLQKIGTDKEVGAPQQSVTYDIVKLTDGATDTLVLNVDWKFGNNTDGTDDAYWKITLVSYDNAADEPRIPDLSAQAGFTIAQDKLNVTLTNTSKYAGSYLWEFGDGTTSTDANPTHTYAAEGIYTIKLTANSTSTNVVYPTSVATQDVTVTTGVILESNIVGGAWKVRKAANSVFVGPGLGSSEWWQVPIEGLEGTAPKPEDDWSCITDDEFIFTAGGKYEYKTNGSGRNDGYMGAPNGCWSDAQIAGSGNGAAFGSGVHSFEFIPASGSNRPRIKLTNGATGSAFIGFYKGYYGGENDKAPGPDQLPPNAGNTVNEYEIMSYVKAGGVETLTISVDISSAHDGTRAWSAVLVR